MPIYNILQYIYTYVYMYRHTYIYIYIHIYTIIKVPKICYPPLYLKISYHTILALLPEIV